jgi:cytochrome c553
MLAIAEYFSKKPWPDLGQPRPPKDVSERALTAEHSVGCTGCHLDRFQGDGTVPRLAGQGREYLAKTMADFRTRARGNNPGMSDLMIATPPDDLAPLAQYLAGL